MKRTKEARTEGAASVRTVGYIRVSTHDQDTAKNRAEILELANSKGFGTVTFVEEKASGWKTSWKERKVAEVVGSLCAGDRIIVPEMSRLGRSMLDIMEILAVCKEKGIDVYAIKGNWSLNGSIESKVLMTLYALFAEIERDLISARTKEALAARRKAGGRLGRPRGPGKSKLDQHREEIVALLKTGSRKSYLARKYSTTEANLHHWLRVRGIEVEEEY